MERQAKVHTNRSKEYLKVLKVTFKYIHCLNPNPARGSDTPYQT